jgi:uncharacterized protein YcbK (DUF882 family)
MPVKRHRPLKRIVGVLFILAFVIVVTKFRGSSLLPYFGMMPVQVSSTGNNADERSGAEDILPVITQPEFSTSDSEDGIENDESLSMADGVLPDAASVFDDQYPGIYNLNPDLLAALQEAAMSARSYGIEFQVDSAWRSVKYQVQLFWDAVAQYGSEAEAAKWVASPEKSQHVSGNAVDIGSDDARDWLVEYGDDYGLCRIYQNEPWHFELRPEAKTDGCPRRYADAAEDPRLQ